MRHQLHIQVRDKPEDEIEHGDRNKGANVARLIGRVVDCGGFGTHPKRTPLYFQKFVWFGKVQARGQDLLASGTQRSGASFYSTLYVKGHSGEGQGYPFLE